MTTLQHSDHIKNIDLFVKNLNEELSNSKDPKVQTEIKKIKSLYMVFVLKGQDGGIWEIDVRDGIGHARKVENIDNSRKPDSKLESTVKTLLKIATGQKKPVTAFLKREIKFSGDRNAFQPIRGALKNVSAKMAPEIEKIKAQLKQQGNVVVDGTGDEMFDTIFIKSSNPKWMRDSACSQCNLCKVSFSLLVRRHHCRLCGQLVCGSCSGNKFAGKRVCDRCFQQRIGTALGVNVAGSGKTSAGRVEKAETVVEKPEEANLPYHKLKARLNIEQQRPIRTNVVDSRSHSVLDFARASLSRLRTLEKQYNALAATTITEKLARMFFHLLPTAMVGVPLCLSWYSILSIGSTFKTMPFEGMPVESNAWLPSTKLVLGLTVVIATSKWWKYSAMCSSVAFSMFLYLHHKAQLVIALQSILTAPLLSHVGSLYPASVQFATPILTNISSIIASRYLLSAAGISLGIVCTLAHRMFGRFVHIYSTAGVVIGTYFLAHVTMEKALHLSDSAQERVYLMISKMMAPFVCNQFIALKSVFVKFGQYLSTRADVVPPEWSSSLSKLQDDMPPDTVQYVERTVEKEFGKPFSEIFEEFDFTPLASASIAQVHKAKLVCKKRGGLPVAVKVQHEGVADLIMGDMGAATRIVSVIAWLNPKFEIVRILHDAWSKELFKELDFHREAENLRRVRRNLQRQGLIAPDSTRNELEEEVEDEDEIEDEMRPQDQVLVPKVLDEYVGTKTFVMTFIDGFKITDVEMLDLYGIDKVELLRKVVQSYASQLYVDGFFNADPHAGNLMVAIDKRDNVAKPVLLDFGMVVTLTDHHRIGYCNLVHSISQLCISGVSESIKNVGYQNSQSDMFPERDLEFFQFLMRDTGDPKSQRKDFEKFKDRRVSQRKEDKKNDPNLEGRFFSSFPESLIFLFRVLSLLRGLCATLHVPLNYLDIMSDYAESALFLEYKESEFNHKLINHPKVPRSITSTKSNSFGAIENDICDLIRQVFKGEHQDQEGSDSTLVGIQIHCIQNGKTVVDIAAGVRGAVDPRPLTNDTLFPLMDATQVLETLATMRCVEKGHLRLADKVSAYWEGFVPESLPKESFALKSLISVEQILCHSKTGLENAISPQTSFIALSDNKRCDELIANAEIRAPVCVNDTDITEASYHLFSYGRILSKVLESAIDGMNMETLVYKYVLATGLRVPESADIPLSEIVYGKLENPKEMNVATVSNGFAATIKAMISEGGGVALGGASGTGIPGGVSLDPFMVNSNSIKEKMIPSIGGYSSARAFVRVVDSLFNRSMSSNTVKTMGTTHSIELNSIFGERQWGLGFQLFHLKKNSSQPLFVYQTFGGSITIVCPSRNITLSVFVNNLTLDRVDVRIIVVELCRRLGLGDVSGLYEGGMF